MGVLMSVLPLCLVLHAMKLEHKTAVMLLDQWIICEYVMLRLDSIIPVTSWWMLTVFECPFTTSLNSNMMVVSLFGVLYHVSGYFWRISILDILRCTSLQNIIFEDKFPQPKGIEWWTHVRIVSAQQSTWLVVYFLDNMALQSQHQYSKYLYTYGSFITIPLDTAIKSESS